MTFVYIESVQTISINQLKTLIHWFVCTTQLSLSGISYVGYSTIRRFWEKLLN